MRSRGTLISTVQSHQRCKGGGRRGGRATSSASIGRKARNVTLPSDVQEYRGKTSATYIFEVDDARVVMNYSTSTQNGRSYRLAAFTVDDELDNTGRLRGKDAVKAARNLARIQAHDVAQMKDGTIYKAPAWEGDSSGSKREQAFIKAGFSKPTREGQFGVVKNGKLIPSTQTGTPL